MKEMDWIEERQRWLKELFAIWRSNQRTVLLQKDRPKEADKDI